MIGRFGRYWFSFYGLANRSHYWIGVLTLFAVGLGPIWAEVTGLLSDPTVRLILGAAQLAAVVSFVSIAVRRARDMGGLGWLFLFLVPAVAVIVFGAAPRRVRDTPR